MFLESAVGCHVSKHWRESSPVEASQTWCCTQDQLRLGKERLAEQRAYIVQILSERAREEEANANWHRKVEDELRSEVRRRGLASHSIIETILPYVK